MGIGIITPKIKNGFKKGGVVMDKPKNKITRVHQFAYIFFKLDLDEFVRYQKKKEYEKLKDNPKYEELKAITDCINVLRRYLGLKCLELPEEIAIRMESKDF